jgi:outer membrane biosynthesis protein TonB
VFFILLAAMGGGGYYFLQQSKKKIVEKPAPVPESPVQPEPVIEKKKPQPVVVKRPTPEKKAPVPVVVKQPMPAPQPVPVPVPEKKVAMDVTSIFAGVLPLDERTASTPEVQKRAKAAQQNALIQGTWAEWQALLNRSLQATVKSGGANVLTPAGLATMNKGAAYQLALEQSAFIATLTPAAMKTLTAGSEDPFFNWLLRTPAALESWLLTARPEFDDVAGALSKWQALARANPEAMGRYHALALACSLVYEKPFESRWNNDYLTITAEGRYAYYTKHAEKGDLVVKPDKLTARDLVWTVSAPVPESEMEWAMHKMHLGQKEWGSCYETIEYDMERAVKDVDKYDAYTFSEIMKKGGICGDRAYFSSNTARAVGIPATTVGGDGARGGHAWVTWLSADNQWGFEGRFDGYPLGHAFNPQTGRNESEQEFIRRSDRYASDIGLLHGLRPVWLARAVEATDDIALATKIFDVASVLGEKVPDVWHAKLVFWSAHCGSAPLDQWRPFLEALKRSMKADPNVLAEARTAEEKFVFPRQDTKLAIKELKKDMRKMGQADEETSVDQADQIAKVIKQQASVLQAKGPLDAVRSLYDKSFREYGGNPAVFKMLARDCWSFVKTDAVIAKKVCRDMEAAFRRDINTGGDYFDVTSQMSALEVIARCYREIGEDKKAESLTKNAKKANAEAARDAL